MKTQIFNLTFKQLVIGLFILLTGQVYGQTLDTILVKTANVNEQDEIYARSSNFDLVIQTWAKNEVNVKYDLFVEAESNKDALDFIQAFSQFIDEGFKDKGKITVSDRINSLERNNRKVKVKFDRTGKTFVLKEFKGIIIIHMPEKNSLNVSSSFRSVEIEDLNADATISVNSGSLKMGSCNNLILKANFSRNMKVGNAQDAKMNLNSSGLKMGRIENDLTLNGSFSDVEIEGIGNTAKIDLNSSSFISNDMKHLDADGNFIRNFKVGNVEQAEINLNSSEFSAKKVKSLNVDRASFSTFKIEELGKMQIKSFSSTKLYVDYLNSMEAGNCNFSNFYIGDLKERFIVSSNSGNINIENVLAGFDEINIDGKFVTTDIHVSDGNNYKIKADFQFPNFHFKNINYEKHDVEMSHETIEGWSGNKEKATSKINFTCQSCKVTLD